MVKKINVLSPKFRVEEVLSEIRDCLEKGWTGMGYKTTEFEAAWAKYTHLNNCHFISSATAGLHLAIRTLSHFGNWNKDDEIITTPLTFVSTNHSILYENFKPVFADIDEYLCVDPKNLEELLTPKTRALIFVGIGGNAGNLDIVSNFCKANGIKLILDAAHMSGTYVKGPNSESIHVGHEADVSIFSYQAVKNLPTADSGMVCFKDREMDSFSRKLSWLGIDKDTFSRSAGGTYKWKYDVPYLGYKYNGNSVMAAIAKVQLKYLDEDNRYRRKLSNQYMLGLDGVPNLIFIKESPYTLKSSKHLFQICLETSQPERDRDGLIENLHSNEIYPGVHYIDNTNYPMYANQSLPNSKRYSNSLLSLPLHLNLDEEDINRVIEKIRNYIL